MKFKVLPIIFHRLNEKDVLTCRLVCKRWKRSFDHILQNHPVRRPYCKDNNFHKRFKKFPVPAVEAKLLNLGAVRFNKIEQLETFTESMSTWRSNPFPARAVVFQWDSEVKTGESVARSVSRFAERFGKYIWYLKISCAVADKSHHSYFKLIPEFLQNTPNLKALTPNWPPIYCSSEDNTQDYLRTLPELPYLESFSLNQETRLWILQDLLLFRYSSQIRRLDLSYNLLVECYVRNVPIRLEMLRIFLQNVEDMGSFIPVLNHFQPRVLELDITNCVPNRLDVVNVSSLHPLVSTVEALIVHATRFCIPLVFLQQLTSLKDIYFEWLDKMMLVPDGGSSNLEDASNSITYILRKSDDFVELNSSHKDAVGVVDRVWTRQWRQSFKSLPTLKTITLERHYN